jgi:phage gp29-like protein
LADRARLKAADLDRELKVSPVFGSRYAVAKRPPKQQTPPSNTQDRPLPVVTVFRQHDKLEQFLAVMREHDFGVFSRSAPMVEETMSDDRIYGTAMTRIGAILSAPMKFQPAGTSPMEIEVAEEIGGTNDKRGVWEQMFSTAAAAEILKWGQHLGIAFGKYAWEKTATRWQPRLVPWHPASVRWDWQSRRFVAQTDSGRYVVLPRPDEQPRGDGQWFVYCPYGVEYGWRSALIRTLAFKYLSRQWTERDHDRLNEREGMGILKAIVPPGNSQPAQREDFFRSLEQVGSEAVVMCPQNEKGEGYDVDKVEFMARTWESFNTRRENLNTDIAITILGQNLTTEVQAGSRAAAMVHEVLRIDKALQDAKLGLVLRAQMLTWYCEFNHGDPELAPTPIYEVEPPTDDQGEATALKTLGEAGALLKTANPRTDVVAIWEANGIPMISEEEFAAQVAARAEEMAAAGEQAGGMQLTEGGGADGPDEPGDQMKGGAGGFAVGDRVKVKGKPHMPGQSTGTIKIVEGNSYGILFDGDEEVHKWYVEAELEPESGAGARKQTKAHALASTQGEIKKRYEFMGLPIAVENVAGSIRLWTDVDGKETGSTKMLCDYGFIEGHLSGDGEELDCYIGPVAEAADVYVVHQLKAPDYRGHDEDKVMLGFYSADDAKTCFLAHRNDPRAFGSMSVIPLERFKVALNRRPEGSTRKIRASIDVSRAATAQALVALAFKGKGGASRTSAGKARAAKYQDTLTKRAIEAGARALAPSLEHLFDHVQKAESLADLRKKLPGLQHGMDLQGLAKVIYQTNILSKLAGIHEAKKET